MKKTWTMVAPPEPGPSVTRLVDREDSVWRRTEYGWKVTDEGASWTWANLLTMYGPVTAEVPDPIVITDEMLSEGWNASFNLGVIRHNLVRALRAGGYEVAE